MIIPYQAMFPVYSRYNPDFIIRCHLIITFYGMFSSNFVVGGDIIISIIIWYLSAALIATGQK